MNYRLTLFACVLALNTISLLAENCLAGVQKKIDKFLELNEKYENTESRTWHSWATGVNPQAKIGEDINEFLDDVLELLTNEEIADIRKQSLKLKKKNQKIESDITDLSLQHASAKEDVSAFTFWEKDQKDIENSISKKKKQIEQNNAKVKLNTQRLTEYLKENGINLNEKDLNFFLETVTGNDYAQTCGILINTYTIFDQLQKTMLADNENIHIAKRCYGIFWLTTEAYYYQLESFYNRIDTQYLARLRVLKDENDALMAETKQYADSNPSTYASNLSAQRVTSRAITEYQTFLTQQQTNIRQQMTSVKQILDHARNTYKTVNLAQNLYQSIESNLKDYRALMTVPIPNLAPFRNHALESKMGELTNVMIAE